MPRLISLSRLVIDSELHPRCNVNSHNVAAIVDAIVSGADLPPIVACKRTKRISDGVHRYYAMLRLYGEGHRTLVVEKSYKSDAEFFEDAMRYNAQHGYKLDAADRTHCLLLAERIGLSIDRVAGALCVPVERLGALRNTRVANSPAGLSVPIKRTISHVHGRRLTERQMEANDKLSGMNQSFYANQLIELIESELLDVENDELIDRLRVLHGLLEGVLSVM